MMSVGTWQMWVGFVIFIVFILFVDLYLLGENRPHRMSARSALIWSIFWFSLALLFNFGLWIYLNKTHNPVVADTTSVNFLTGLLLEKALAVDNIFVFLLIFKRFNIPHPYQRRVFLYGVMGALLFRGIMIVAGSALIQAFEWVLYVFGAFLLVTGFKMFFTKESVQEIEHHPMVVFLSKRLRLTKILHEEKFFVRQNNHWYFTPLFLVLVLIEISDVVFATDSIPAIFAITTDAFVVFTSNVFAILGLRALYFLLANMVDRFYYLQYGLAFILILVGAKLLLMKWLHISAVASLLMIFLILLLSVLFSLLRAKNHAKR